MQIAQLVGKRSTCIRSDRQVGAVIVREKRILATGYNGAPTGLAHCEEVGCLRERLRIPSGERHELCRGLHAEQNAIIQAAVCGTSIKDAVVYCTHVPCIICAKMLINAALRTIYYQKGYPDELAVSMLKEAGIALVQVPFNDAGDDQDEGSKL